MSTFQWFAHSFWTVLSIVVLCQFAYADLPSSIQKCHLEDNECIARTLQHILHTYTKGELSFGMPAVDEIPFKNVVLADAKGDGPMQMIFKFNSVNIYGIEKSLVEHVSGFNLDPLKSKISVNITVPKLLAKGQYTIGGRVLLLPLEGEGPAEIILTNFRISLKLKLKLDEVRDGKQYVQLDKLKCASDTELMETRLENLYNGNKELSETLNGIMRENWRDFWNEVRVGVNELIFSFVKTSLKSILHELSYDDFFKKS